LAKYISFSLFAVRPDAPQNGFIGFGFLVKVRPDAPLVRPDAPAVRPDAPQNYFQSKIIFLMKSIKNQISSPS